MNLSSLKTPLTAVAVAAVALTLVACGKKGGDDAQVIKIGHVGPTSGAIAHLGKDNENGAIMAVEEINAEAAELMHRSSQALHEQTEHLRTQVREVREKTLGYIQHEPVKSVFIAAATGAALVLLSNWLSQRIK